MSTPTIPGVSRYALVSEIYRALTSEYGSMDCWAAADAAINYIATHQEPVTCICGAEYDGCPQCAADDAYEKGRKDAACDREHADEWVEVDEGERADLPDGVRLREEWTKGRWEDTIRLLVHRDDLPDDPRALIARELGPAKADTFLGLLDEHGWTVTRKGER